MCCLFFCLQGGGAWAGRGIATGAVERWMEFGLESVGSRRSWCSDGGGPRERVRAEREKGGEGQKRERWWWQVEK